ncbi:MAG TPA: GntR family transcriptional regulator [Allosphingosinicella sp.]|jgi:DNA-binding GntR family transcriptional regulator|nr:GntR family transcriptional regulator [Allosphingosinicella sp.]
MDAANDVAEMLPHAAELDLKDRMDSLVGRIASEIAREITEGRLPPGADLNSVELASRFGTSRTPVREALMLLEKEGLVEIPPRRRPRVSSISLAEVEELYQIRSVLNAMMMRLFVRNATDEQLREMVALHDEVKRAVVRSPDEFQDARRRLHNFWLDECGNGSLRNLLSTWKMRMSVSRLVSYSSDDIERSLKDHDRIITACLERDEPLVMALMQSMTLHGLEAIKRQRSAKG